MINQILNVGDAGDDIRLNVVFFGNCQKNGFRSVQTGFEGFSAACYDLVGSSKTFSAHNLISLCLIKIGPPRHKDTVKVSGVSPANCRKGPIKSIN